MLLSHLPRWCFLVTLWGQLDGCCHFADVERRPALPRWLSGKESACQHGRHGFNPWVGKIPLEKGLAIPWGVPWTEELRGLQSMGSQRVGHDLATHQQQQRETQWFNGLCTKPGVRLSNSFRVKQLTSAEPWSSGFRSFPPAPGALAVKDLQLWPMCLASLRNDREGGSLVWPRVLRGQSGLTLSSVVQVESLFYLCIFLFLKGLLMWTILKSLLNLLQYCFCLMFWFFEWEAYGIVASPPGIDPIPHASEGEVLTTWLSEKSQTLCFALKAAEAQADACVRLHGHLLLSVQCFLDHSVLLPNTHTMCAGHSLPWNTPASHPGSSQSSWVWKGQPLLIVGQQRQDTRMCPAVGLGANTGGVWISVFLRQVWGSKRSQTLGPFPMGEKGESELHSQLT